MAIPLVRSLNTLLFFALLVSTINAQSNTPVELKSHPLKENISEIFEMRSQFTDDNPAADGRRFSSRSRKVLSSILKSQFSDSPIDGIMSFVDSVSPGEIRSMISSSAKHLSTIVEDDQLRFKVEPIGISEFAISYFGIQDTTRLCFDHSQFTITIPLMGSGSGLTSMPVMMDSAKVVEASSIPFLLFEHAILSAINNGADTAQIDKDITIFFLRKYLGGRDSLTSYIYKTPSAARLGRCYSLRIISESRNSHFTEQYIMNGSVILSVDQSSIDEMELQGEFSYSIKTSTLTTNTRGQCNLRIERN